MKKIVIPMLMAILFIAYLAPGLYINTGSQLVSLRDFTGILSPALIGSFVLLGVLTLIAKHITRWHQSYRIYSRWTKPRRFDRNLIVIGAGAAGLVSAYIAATVKAKVTLIEGHKMGGDCLNYGCIPSKTLIRSAKFIKQVSRASTLGLPNAVVVSDFPSVMKRVHRVINRVAPHDSIERYTALGVEVIQGQAHITSPWSVEVNGRTLSTRAIVIATGARPVVPAIPGLDQVCYYTSDTLWSLTEKPERLVVLGGGPIGCELSQVYARLGCKVTLVVKGSRLLPREDSDVANLVSAALLEDGIHILYNTEAIRCERENDDQRLVVSDQGAEQVLVFDALLCAVGRVARTEGFGLEELGIPLTNLHTIETDGFLQTPYPNIFACGDVAGPYQFTHTASHQAWYATVNALFGGLKRFKVDYTVIPRAIFTDPEVARVGLSEDEATRKKIDYEVVKYGLDELDRAITDEAAFGFIKVLTVPGKDKILGVTIVGEHASELLAEFVLAMKYGLGLDKILGTVHTYPTWSESAKYVAGEWKRAHTPHRLLSWAERYHAWKRG